MPVHDPTTANTALWAHYLQDQWGPWIDPLEQGYVTHAIAAAVAGWLTLTYAPRVRRLYDANAPEVSRFVEETRLRTEADAIPPELSRRPARARPRAPRVAPRAPATAATR
jgi:hypothetical protein